MKTRIQRILSLLLVLALCGGVLSTCALAADVPTEEPETVTQTAEPEQEAAEPEPETAEDTVPEETPAPEESLTEEAAETESVEESVPEEAGTVEAPVLMAEDEGADGAAFGDVPSGSVAAWTLEAWTNDALSTSEVKALLNSQTLYPQRTGWMELDNLIARMLANAGSDTYSKLWYMYDWLVKNVTYSWEGYSNTNASVASYNSVNKYNYLKDMTYEDGLQKSIPDDMANRTYHILTAKKGVCYDYAIAYAVIARYVGIEAYVMTGRFTFENTSLGAGHHGWSVLMLNGQEYLFDPQRDARNWEQNNKHTGYYFGIPSGNTYRYNPNYWTADQTANPQRRESMLPVTADRAHKITVTVSASGGTVTGAGSYITGNTVTLNATANSGMRFAGWYDSSGKQLSTSAKYTFTAADDVTLTAKFIAIYTITVQGSASGSVSGGGTYTAGSAVTLKATPASGKSFVGWYTPDGTLLSSSASYSFTAAKNLTACALFSGDYFIDIPSGSWYRSAAEEAASRGLIQGYGSSVIFAGSEKFTRAMAVTIIARLDGADVSAAPASPFRDVAGGSWYEASVNWAYANQVTTGISATAFGPDRTITRQEFIVMLVRYLASKGYTAEEAKLSFKDTSDISDWAVSGIRVGYAMGLVMGDDTGKVLPLHELTRAEGATLMVRAARYMEEH